MVARLLFFSELFVVLGITPSCTVQLADSELRFAISIASGSWPKTGQAESTETIDEFDEQ